jgi:hypothetical protein
MSDAEDRAFEAEYNKRIAQEQRTADAMAEIAQTALQGVSSLFSQQLLSSMQTAGTVNRRFTAEYTALSRQRRAEQLVEQGVAKTAAEAQRMVAEEAEAAEAQKTAAAKEGMAQRLVSQAIEWGIKAIGSLADGNYGAAALYGAAAAAAGGAAATLHHQAKDLTQSRGYTAEENDQLSGLRSGGSGSGGAREYGGSGGGSGGGDRVVRETVILIGPAGMSMADVARITARGYEEARRRDMISREAA